MGQALGDALGFVVEARPPAEAGAYVDGCLRAGRAGAVSHPDFPFGQYSDDTQLARELVLSIVDARGWSADRFAGRIAQLFAMGRDVGAGPGTRAAALRIHAGEHWSRAATPAPYAGNGSAMRVSPVGVLFRRDLARVAAVAGEQSRVTHADPRCEAGAIAVATAAALATGTDRVDTKVFVRRVAGAAELADGSVGAAIRLLDEWAALAPSLVKERLRNAGLDPAFSGQWQGISAFVVPSVVWSLYAFLRSPDDYWDTVCTAIEAGGDTDTMAAIAGGLSGARLGPAGLPADLVERVTDRGEWGHRELTDLARQAASLVEG